MNPVTTLKKRARTRHKRSRWLTAEELRYVAEHADRQGCEATQRTLNLSVTCVRRAMRLHGVKPWPIGHPRLK